MGEVAALPMTRIDRNRAPPLFRPISSGLPVKRRLFGGPVDHAKINQVLQKELNKIREEDTSRWNFDFVAEKPLKPGRYAWERVGRCPAEPQDGGGSSEDAGEGSSERRGQRQTQITEFMRKRKLSTSEKTNDTSLSKVRRRSST